MLARRPDQSLLTPGGSSCRPPVLPLPENPNHKGRTLAATTRHACRVILLPLDEDDYAGPVGEFASEEPGHTLRRSVFTA